MGRGHVGHYEILEELGTGGMGVVYRARDTRLRRDVALKMLRHDGPWPAGAKERVLREARAISALNHPNICAVYDVAEQDGQTFIVMELVSGTPLTLRVSPSGLDPETVTRWGAQLGDALEHAHKHGIVHRDLKPSNVVVTPEGRLKIVDFGVAARALMATAETTVLETEGLPAVAGTPPYMAPEVIRGDVADPRSDIWSLGVVLHELLSGARPFNGPTPHDVTASILRDSPTALPRHVPPGLATVVRRCLAKDPSARYQRAGEVRAALEAIETRAGRRIPAAARWAAGVAGALVLAAGIIGLARSLPAADGVASWLLRPRSTPSSNAGSAIGSIAVLPFRNLSGDAEQDYFADGMTAALISELARTSSLKVISQTSVMRYRAGVDRSLPQIAGDLGVAGIIEGTVLRVGDRVRIGVDLIDAATDRHVWVETYDRPLADVLALQAEIARAVVTRVQSGTATDTALQVRESGRVDPVAYDLFIRGEISILQGSPAAVDRAVGYYEQAIARDPRFAAAYAGLAGGLFAQEFWGGAPRARVIDKVRENTDKALALDPHLADGHTMKGRLLLNYDWDLRGAEASLKRAIELAPNLAYAHETYCWVLLALGRLDEAIEHGNMAASLDPRAPYMVDTAGRVLHRSRRFREAEERYKQALAVDPAFPVVYRHLAQLYTHQRRFDEAREMLDRRARLPSAQPARAERAILAAASGDGDTARRLLKGLRPMGRARTYIALGEYDLAFVEMDAAIREKQFGLHMMTDPDFDPVRRDPRFARLLERMGLPVYVFVAMGTPPSSR